MVSHYPAETMRTCLMALMQFVHA